MVKIYHDHDLFVMASVFYRCLDTASMSLHLGKNQKQYIATVYLYLFNLNNISQYIVTIPQIDTIF